MGNVRICDLKSFIFWENIMQFKYFNYKTLLGLLCIIFGTFFFAGCSSYPLHSAIQAGDTDKSIKLINKDSVNVFDKNDNSPLHWAAYKGNLEVAKTLIAASADVNIKNKIGATPLNSASRQGHIEIVKLLIENGAEVDAVTSKGTSALLIAAENGHTETIRFLAASGANVNMNNEGGVTPLAISAWKGYQEQIKILLDAGADVNKHTSEGITPLMQSCAGGHTGIALMLLKARADINTKSHKGSTALYFACRNNHLETALLLLEHGADPCAGNPEFGFPLDLAIDKRNYELVRLLAGKGARVEDCQDKYSLLKLAAESKDIDYLTELLNKGISISESDKNGETIMHYCASKGHTEVVAILINRGIDVNIADKSGQTPLHRAVSGGKEETVKRLIAAGSNVNAKSSKGLTPLHIMALKLDSPKTDPIVEILYDNGVTAEELPGSPGLSGKTMALYGLVLDNNMDPAKAKEYFKRAIPLLQAAYNLADKKAKSAKSRAFWTSAFEPLPSTSTYRQGAIQQNMMRSFQTIAGGGRSSGELYLTAASSRGEAESYKKWLEECQKHLQ